MWYRVLRSLLEPSRLLQVQFFSSYFDGSIAQETSEGDLLTATTSIHLKALLESKENLLVTQKEIIY